MALAEQRKEDECVLHVHLYYVVRKDGGGSAGTSLL